MLAKHMQATTKPWPFVALMLWASTSAAQDYYVYVANESEDTVSLVRFDGNQAETVKTIPVGNILTEIEGPHGLTISPDGTHWYVSLAHGQPYGSVVKYRTDTNEKVGSATLGLFPATMHISPANGLLYAVNFNLHGAMEPSSVSVVDPVHMIEVGRVNTGIMPHGSRLSPEGDWHFSVSMMDGMLHKIDATSLKLTQRLQVGSRPTWVEHHPHTEHVYIAENGGHAIVEVDLASWEITRKIPAEGAPYNLAVTPDGHHIVVTLKGADAIGIYDIQTGEEVARIPSSRRIPHGVVISPDGRYAFVSSESIGSKPGALDVIDLHTKVLVASTDVGQQAGGIAFWKISPAP